ncbi:serine/threonine protein kinase ppk15, putative [Entamoeba invadens IP1]|uniref:serine/threonine protein kinase ppk15, putative n=1 Tax=Entamoeba invadens IP1 TaxID=370355 RepID=UPI0002C3EA7C|nr:serine/threonine protein kinase ppk15, putative [Entamoeba invadens IP1]ELP93119.1 serine/threonine protein kinase ppk15, putative [Entamoeba invadens IP1]|eukprot:XP_004259890.1 serine/threonine protein kinase ppk15, putative [Entamoeba invadens IP1]
MSCFSPTIQNNTFTDRIENKTKNATMCYNNVLKRCKYTSSQIITTPKEATQNNYRDNEAFDLIIHVDEVLGTATSLEGPQFSFDGITLSRYKIVQLLGKGNFGQVVKCVDLNTNQYVAVKVLKSIPSYFKQSLIETTVLQIVNEYLESSERSNILQMIDYFMFYNHICIVTEFLGIDLCELLYRNSNHGFKIQIIRKFLKQIINSLEILSRGNIIHCDIKPENVLIVNHSSTVKLIDFGSACFENHTFYQYIQSRYYRSPEVALGIPYSCAIDMWSLGCLTAVFYFGVPLFSTKSEYSLLRRMVSTLGPIPDTMLEKGTKTLKYFIKENNTFRFKTIQEYEKDNNTTLPQDQEYFKYEKLEDLVLKNKTSGEQFFGAETQNALLDFLKRCLTFDPKERMTPDQAITHPFIVGCDMTNYTIPKRKLPFCENTKFVQTVPDEISEPFCELSNTHFNYQKYFLYFQGALKKGFVINILSKFNKIEGITPPLLDGVIGDWTFKKIEKLKEKQNSVPRHFDAKTCQLVNSRFRIKIESTEKVKSLPSSLISSPRNRSDEVSRKVKLSIMEEKVERERAKILMKEKKLDKKKKSETEKAEREVKHLINPRSWFKRANSEIQMSTIHREDSPKNISKSPTKSEQPTEKKKHFFFNFSKNEKKD